MKRLILAMCIAASVQIPAESRTLAGGVDKSQEILDWTEWRARVQNEIHSRAQTYIKSGRFVFAGSVDIRYTINRRGRVSIEILSDTSTNLGRLIPYVISSLQGEKILKFPRSSRRHEVVSEIIYSISNKEEIEYNSEDFEEIGG